MEAPVRNEILKILQRFLVGDQDSLLSKSENDLIDAGITFVTQVMLGKFRRKRMRPYLMQLFDIPAFVERLSHWRSPVVEGFEYHAESNILHLSCEAYNREFIMKVIEKCGKELMHIPNNNNMLPCYYLQYNHLHHKDIFSLLKFFHENGVDLTPLKEDIFNLYDVNRAKTDPTILTLNYKAHRKTIREIIRFFYENQLLTVDDTKRIESIFKTVIKTYNWRSCKINHQFPSLNKELINCYQVLMKSHPGEQDGTLYGFLTKFSVWKFFVAAYPELVDFWIRFKLEEKDIADLISRTLDNLIWFNDEKKLDFVVAYLPLVRNNARIIDQLTATATKLNNLIAIVKFHTREIPEEYLLLLKPRLEAWVYGPIYTKHEQDNFSFEIDKLPSDLVALVIGFAPYKTVRAISLTCKKFREFVAKNVFIYRNLMQRYFPLEDIIPQQTNENLFRAKYEKKFRVQPAQWFSKSEGYCALEVTKNILIWTSVTDFGLYDFETNSGRRSKLNTADQRRGTSAARMFNDVLFVKYFETLQTYATNDLHPIGNFNIPEMTGSHFAINEQYLYCKNLIFDWQKAKVVSQHRSNIKKCVIRNGLCYGVTEDELCVVDPRAKSAVVLAQEVDFSPLHQDTDVAFNVYDHNIYTAHNLVEIFDTRKMDQSRKSATGIGRNKVIDLVSMNVWASEAVWDLTDLKWSYCPRGCEYETRLTVCNGKHVIFSEGYSLHIRPVSGTAYFPYDDFRQ